MSVARVKAPYVLHAVRLCFLSMLASRRNARRLLFSPCSVAFWVYRDLAFLFALLFSCNRLVDPYGCRAASPLTLCPCRIYCGLLSTHLPTRAELASISAGPPDGQPPGHGLLHFFYREHRHFCVFLLRPIAVFAFCFCCTNNGCERVVVMLTRLFFYVLVVCYFHTWQIETFGRVTLEAMSCGVACVVNRECGAHLVKVGGRVAVYGPNRLSVACVL